MHCITVGENRVQSGWVERWVSGSKCITLGEVQVGVHWREVQWGKVQWGKLQVGIVGGYYAMLWVELVGVQCGKVQVSTVGGVGVQW